MTELIKIHQTEGRPGVDARELHEFLEVGRDFSSWIKQRIEKYDFSEGVDYISTFTKTGERKNVKVHDYTLSLDMAKELAMVENNDRGRQARRYFIEAEKLYKDQVKKQVPQTYAEALRLAADQAEQLEKQAEKIEKQEPIVRSAKAILHIPESDTISITDVAKVFGLKPRAHVFPFLREKGYLTKKDLPTSKAIKENVLVERVIDPGGRRQKSAACVSVSQTFTWEQKIYPKIVEWLGDDFNKKDMFSYIK